MRAFRATVEREECSQPLSLSVRCCIGMPLLQCVGMPDPSWTSPVISNLVGFPQKMRRRRTCHLTCGSREAVALRSAVFTSSRVGACSEDLGTSARTSSHSLRCTFGTMSNAGQHGISKVLPPTTVPPHALSTRSSEELLAACFCLGSGL